MSKIEEIYKKWQTLATYDSDLINELKEISDDEAKINDRFYKNLNFGTAGIRGIIGAGINRINVYVVGRVTQAFCAYLKSFKEKNSVVIGFDNRIKSELFAKIAAQVLAINGIRVKIFRELKPVPMLSYAVRFLNCDGGIMITASHNPANYNGYKIYGSDGCQIVDDAAKKISSFLDQIDMFSIKFGNFEDGLKSGLISYCDDEVECSFLDCVEQSLIEPKILQNSSLRVVYTPLNGSGMEPLSRMFKKFNINSVHVVEQQKYPDGNFPTCKSPNPEQIAAFDLAIKQSENYRPNVIIATDPDCDRVGVVVFNSEGGHTILNGNQIGVLMFDYICSQRIRMGTMPKGAVLIKTIVSTPMAEKIAKHYGVEVENVLTGFKYIGEKIGLFERTNEQDRFIFGFEESQGYLAGSYVRDKDGVFAAMMVCEMVEFYRNQNKTLIDVLNGLYFKFGHYRSAVQSYELNGQSGMDKMAKIMHYFRNSAFEFVGSFKIMFKVDYLVSKKYSLEDGSIEQIDLPKSNVVEFDFENDLEIVIRVSGTEPKLKIYYHCVGHSSNQADEITNSVKSHFNKLIEDIVDE